MEHNDILDINLVEMPLFKMVKEGEIYCPNGLNFLRGCL
jgi:hypothetical protein